MACSSLYGEGGVRVSSSSSALHLDPIFLEQCTTRLHLVIQQVQEKILNNPSTNYKLFCPITLDVPIDPVVTNCGHLFDKESIQKWKAQDSKCAVCRGSLRYIISMSALQELVEKQFSQDPVPTSSYFKEHRVQDDASCLVSATSCSDDQEDTEVSAQASEGQIDYTLIPKVYDRLEDPERATLNRLYLSLYLLYLGKIEEVITTLRCCHPDMCKVSVLITGLELCVSCSSNDVKLAMTYARAQNRADRMFIYQQILTHDPCQWDAYRKLVSLITDQKGKKQLLSKAIERARATQQVDIERSFLQEQEIWLRSSRISKEEWASICTMKLPPYPQELEDFLEEECTFWLGKKRVETHIVVPLFPMVMMDGVALPLTLDSLNRLDKSAGGAGYSDVAKNLFPYMVAKGEFHYAVMTKEVIPGSEHPSFDPQFRLLPCGYEVPSVFDAVRTILWENRRSGARYVSKDTKTIPTRCKKTKEGFSWVIGGLTSSGITILHREFLRSIGIRGWKEF